MKKMKDSVPIEIKIHLPNSIEELVHFIERSKATVKRLQDDLNRDIRPFNPSQMHSLGVIYGESRLGRRLKKAGADKDDRFLPKGVSKKRCN